MVRLDGGLGVPNLESAARADGFERAASLEQITHLKGWGHCGYRKANKARSEGKKAPCHGDHLSMARIRNADMIIRISERK
jgi:hypothetical protein